MGRLNFLNDTAELQVFYDEPHPERWRRHQDSTLEDELYLAVDNA